MKLLIVDDKEENLYMLETLLKGSGYEVVSAKNGVEALEKLKRNSVDMIISDILMPKMDGFQLCRECKSDDTLRKIPFVFYTATYTNKKDEEFALSLGAEKFIIKPVDPDVFLKILEGVIEEHRKGALAAQRKPIEKEEVYLVEYNKRLIQKLEKKMLDLENANKELKELEQKYRELVDNANDAVIVIEPTDYLGFVNPKFCETMGYTMEEAKKLHISKLVHPEDLIMVTENIRKRLAGEEVPRHYEFRVMTKSGETIYVDYNASLIERERKTVGIQAMIRDITESKRAEEVLRNAEADWRNSFNSLEDVMLIIDRDYNIENINEIGLKLLGKSKEEVIGKKCYQIISGADSPIEKCPCMKSLETKKVESLDRYEERFGKYYSIKTSPIFDDNGEIIKFVDLRRDITERKHAEDQIKTSLKEKEVLLLEIHHRVKNSLQVVSSLLNMQARAAKDKGIKDILSEARNRINTIALIHSQLYESENLSEINMKGFMDKLLVQLLQIHSVPDRKITPIVHAVECSLPISIAVPVGLIANELLTNAFKHAFVNRKEGKVEVRISVSDEGVVSLTVSDDGVGLPEGFDVNASKTLGLRVVKVLVEDQLEGNLEVVSDKGATFKVQFEIAKE